VYYGHEFDLSGSCDIIGQVQGKGFQGGTCPTAVTTFHWVNIDNMALSQ